MPLSDDFKKRAGTVLTSIAKADATRAKGKGSVRAIAEHEAKFWKDVDEQDKEEKNRANLKKYGTIHPEWGKPL